MAMHGITRVKENEVLTFPLTYIGMSNYQFNKVLLSIEKNIVSNVNVNNPDQITTLTQIYIY